MKKLFRLIEKAKTSKLNLLLLNIVLSQAVPFNKPHGLRIKEIYPDGFNVFLPYKRRNINHIKGIHACALATLAEFTCGLTMMMNLASDEYRLIMKSMSMTYHYQARTDVFVSVRLSKEWMDNNVFSHMTNADSIFAEVKADVFDIQQNLICTATINWQIKKWQHVKTK